MRLLLILLLLSASSLANDILQPVEYQLGVHSTKIEHTWRGEQNVANYDATTKSISITAWNKHNFGVRVAYEKGEVMTTIGRYENVLVDLKFIGSLEVAYRFFVSDDAYIFGGIGTYRIPLPMTTVKSGYFRNDSDDEGYHLGVTTRHGDWSIAYRFTQYSRIKSKLYDEWTRGHSIHVSYSF